MYVGNDPLNLSDPTGREEQTLFLGIEWEAIFGQDGAGSATGVFVNFGGPEGFRVGTFDQEMIDAAGIDTGASIFVGGLAGSLENDFQGGASNLEVDVPTDVPGLALTGQMTITDTGRVGVGAEIGVAPPGVSATRTETTVTNVVTDEQMGQAIQDTPDRIREGLPGVPDRYWDR